MDQRVLDAYDIEEISIGDYILTGGEQAAQIMLDAVIRLLPGVLGNSESLADESFENFLLEHGPVHPSGCLGRKGSSGNFAERPS